jgi:hypothetical protein
VTPSRTALTELGTALGLVARDDAPWPDSVLAAEVPGMERDVWLPVVAPSLATGSRTRDLLLSAMANGRAFRAQVLGGRAPQRVLWAGRDKSVWSSEVPRDLVVDDVWFIQAKHDSTCVLNTSPHAVFEVLTAESDEAAQPSWFQVTAPLELQAYYDAVRETAGRALDGLPDRVGDLGPSHRVTLKAVLPRRDALGDDDARAYAVLCGAVSERTADRWSSRLAQATPTQRARLLLRVLRIAGGPYWLLGAKATTPLRLRVCDTREWRQRFELRRFDVSAADAGQPQVDWRATVRERASGACHEVAGYCEIRWSHGKLQGNPECKVQVRTPLAELPGYDPMDGLAARPPGA